MRANKRMQLAGASLQRNVGYARPIPSKRGVLLRERRPSLRFAIMARYKVLKSVAHNLAHSFGSVMNYWGGDCVMCHLVRQVKRTKCRELRLNLLTRDVGPTDILTRPIVQSCDQYAKDFGRLVTASGAALDMINSAQLTVRTTLSPQSATEAAKALVGRVAVSVQLIDDRGRMHQARVFEDYKCGPLR